MQPDLYLLFARYILGDLAERRDQAGEKPRRGDRRFRVIAGVEQRTPLQGDHVHYLGEEQFRGSDRAFRLTLAVTAYERHLDVEYGTARGQLQTACERVAEVVLYGLADTRPGRLAKVGEAPSGFRMKLSLLERRRGRKPKPPRVAPSTPRVAHTPAVQSEYRDPIFSELDRLIVENDSEPSKQRVRRKPNADVLRLAEVIRVQVGKYRKEHVNWEQQFNGWIGVFEAEHGRDDEWYKRAETAFEQRIEAAQTLLHPTEAGDRTGPPSRLSATQWKRLVANGMCTTASDVAMAAVSLAHLYHEQDKFKEAAAQYKRALMVYAAATVPERFRSVMVPWCDAQIVRCKKSQGPDPVPAMRADSPARSV